MRKATRVLILLSVAELFSMSIWFSASAVAPALENVWGLTATQLAAIVMAVQFGFVSGTLFIAFTNIADVLNTRYVFCLSAVLAALVNAAFVWFGQAVLVALALRFLSGFFLAGIYPPGMKIMATWFKEKRGFAIGVMVGALTVGSALPHWVGSVVREEWQSAIFVSSGLSILASVIVFFFIEDGPYSLPAQKFNFKYVFEVIRAKPIRLAYFGYFGHMWELYAMWTWLPVFLLGTTGANLPTSAGFAAFAVIASGAIGCILYGLLGDRIGRSRSTIFAMVISGACCFLVGFLQTVHPVMLMVICLIWGVTVVADSAQFSTAASELCDPQYMGTVLTLQTSIGFLITMVSIRLVPFLQEIGGWSLAFAVLGAGPVFGILAMLRLSKLPEAVKMASGNR